VVRSLVALAALADGTLVVLVSWDERNAGREMVLGAKQSEDDAAVGECAGVALYAGTEAEVRPVAAMIRRAD
jgi:hypothetical protein